MRDNEVILTGQDQIAGLVNKYYDGLFWQTPAREHMMNLGVLAIPNMDLSHLELLFLMEEVEKVIKAMPLDKAPGRTGLPAIFILHVGISSSRIAGELAGHQQGIGIVTTQERLGCGA